MPLTTLNIQENISLAPLTTVRIGGPARFFLEAHSEEDVVNGVKYALEKGVELFVLGGGSNIVVSDQGFPGLVVKIGLKGITVVEAHKAAEWIRSVSSGHSENKDSNVNLVSVKAGENWDDFVSNCVDLGLAGVECLSGIPGLVGATPVQNVGAYGQEVSDSIVSVRCYDRHRDKIVELSNAECGFSYRTSIFNSTCRDRYIVLSVLYALVPGGRPKIEYRDLQLIFTGRLPSLMETRDAVVAVRSAKSMVIDVNDPNSQSAGSFFKNPIVSSEKLNELIRNLDLEGIPCFEAGENRVKIPAAWLIEKAGFSKGFSSGNVGISTKHTLALVNRGGASAVEMIIMKDRIIEAVAKAFDIILEPEPVFIGLFEAPER